MSSKYEIKDLFETISHSAYLVLKDINCILQLMSKFFSNRLII